MKERKKSNELGTYFVYRVIESIQELNFRLGTEDTVHLRSLIKKKLTLWTVNDVKGEKTHWKDVLQKVFLQLLRGLSR